MDDVRAAGISIPVYRPDLSGNELRYVAECVEFVVTRPEHVNIDQLVLVARDQASARRVHRRA